jgi:polyketide biosynthesis 3-hydroxy-3-methylglutaryl-CoA synthase-like enzyme PksG
MPIGIEAINCYAGVASMDVRALFERRGLDLSRFDNLMLHRKSVALPCEDPVSFGVNAAKPIVDQLTPDERKRIELLITATESGLDFGKSLSTYIHDYLGLSRQCRLFEVKQACYGGTAALQMAAHTIAAEAAPGVKALVIATDISRAAIKGTYIEPSQGAGAVAMLVSDTPQVLDLDVGASGCWSYEVMDTCRPNTEIETGDSDLSMLSYLDCLEHTYQNYADRVEHPDFVQSFDYLSFHTPFGGMVKGAHRMLLRKLKSLPPAEIEADFQRRLQPSLKHCREVGNIYSATLYLALISLLDHASIDQPKRIGLFSYGSGCSSEFFSGVVTPASQSRVRALALGAQLNDRYALTPDEYDSLVDLNREWIWGIKDHETNPERYASIYERTLTGRRRLILNKIKNFHRQYIWS